MVSNLLLSLRRFEGEQRGGASVTAGGEGTHGGGGPTGRVTIKSVSTRFSRAARSLSRLLETIIH